MVIDLKTVESLADFAKIELDAGEKEKIREDLEAVLGYISQLNDVSVDADLIYKDDNFNVFREDENPHESGIYTAKILADAPKTKDGFVVVKQVLEEKKNLSS